MVLRQCAFDSSNPKVCRRERLHSEVKRRVLGRDGDSIVCVVVIVVELSHDHLDVCGSVETTFLRVVTSSWAGPIAMYYQRSECGPL